MIDQCQHIETQLAAQCADSFWRADARPAYESRLLLRYLRGAGTTRVSRSECKALARVLRIDSFRLQLACFDLEGRGLIAIDGDVIRLATRRRAA